MRVPGRATLRHALRHLKGVREGQILMYHRVSDSGPDPWGLSVSPGNFCDQLEFLRRHTSPVPLKQLISADLGKRRSRRLVTVTFDDGYADNLLAAAPLLRQYDIPATVFVTAGAIGNAGGFWWDELADLLLLPGRLPENLQLTIGGEVHQWSLGTSAEYGEADYEKYRTYPAWEEPPTQRHRTYVAIWRLLQPLLDWERRQILDALTIWGGVATTSQPSRRMLTDVEVSTLASDGLIEVGAHTMTHPNLPTLSIDTQRREVTESKACLEKIVNRVVSSFAYPYGETSELTASVVREAGFERACTTDSGFVGPHSDRFQLPRLGATNCDGEALGDRLQRGQV